jgi:hypothetical protein
VQDPTENTRRAMVQEINSDPNLVSDLEKAKEKTWTTDELRAEFEVIGFMAPFVAVRRLTDGRKGSMLFKHSPRIYYGFQED